MDQMQFNKIWEDVQKETADRSRGSFKRALWYGNNSSIIGQNKGLRKGIRNAPRAAVGVALGAAEIPPGLSDIIDAVVDVVMDRGKDLYSDHVKPLIKGNPPMSANEALRKRVKHEIKELKENAFQVIDRNLVKLRDAKNKVTPAIQQLMQSQSHMSYTQVSSNLPVPTSDEEVKKAHDALRAVAEAEYYVDKLMRLVSANEEALKRVREKLDLLKQSMVKTQGEVGDYVKEML